MEHPEQLSRGLVLVKWWLLAIPHYLVVTLFGGGWWLGWWEPSGSRWTGQAPGLIGLLVLFAAVALLFSGRYPHTIFDFVMGLNRWVYRVVAYATLMTDQYPPFRLDQGGNDPAAATDGMPAAMINDLGLPPTIVIKCPHHDAPEPRHRVTIDNVASATTDRSGMDVLSGGPRANCQSSPTGRHRTRRVRRFTAVRRLPRGAVDSGRRAALRWRRRNVWRRRRAPDRR